MNEFSHVLYSAMMVKINMFFYFKATLYEQNGNIKLIIRRRICKSVKCLKTDMLGSIVYNYIHQLCCKIFLFNDQK